jgi:hypothetical protein
VHSQWILQQSVKDFTFTAKVLFTDDSCFTRTEITNIHNEHVWSDLNPHAIRSHRQQLLFSINLSSGSLGDGLRGPHILQATVSGCYYLNFLRTQLSGLLDAVSFNTPLHMWFKNNGVPPDYSSEGRQGLPKNYPGRWIGRGREASVY